ncbi:SMP-30/gluconolaconase/LRE domain-containing protein (plasmid) [Rhizobium phaseoli]|uniref:SMP-30/gluconolactonase/LRE family protein n=1 Tax=Rhizobium phaseoli TaxID=396 RepID=UPI0007F09A63|nr:SMP-30/gluconolactonase/LRE family protein [Rhizobium phaseoli]ANL49100.1 SMP-30/gluconolaconase/LRE domain-containing protein [Rhizobium phaseoli]
MSERPTVTRPGEVQITREAHVPAQILLKGRGLVECPRWHKGELWFADWTSGEIRVLEEKGQSRLVVPAKAPPLSFDFSPENELFVVQSASSSLMRFDGEGLKEFAALGPGRWNEIVIDAVGRIYVNGPSLMLILPDGSVETQAEGFQFPNGMALSQDGCTLVCAESWARLLTAFDVAPDGRLGNRRIWAELPGPPDGICFDSQGAIWYADVANACCRRVREGGEMLDEIKIDRGAFACMLGGDNRSTLFITAARWFGMDKMDQMAETGQIVSVEVNAPGAGWPYN